MNHTYFFYFPWDEHWNEIRLIEKEIDWKKLTKKNDEKNRTKKIDEKIDEKNRTKMY